MSNTANPRLQPTRKDALKTRACLFEAAGEAFARKGFQDASLRKICDAAGVNLGAVKYYFGSKQALYTELLLESHKALLAKSEMPTLETNPDAKEALATWIEWFLGVILSRANHPYLGRIVVREIVQPTTALDDLVLKLFSKVRSELERIISEIGGGSIESKKLSHLTNMTVMLCVMHELARPILVRFEYKPPTELAEIKQLAGTISKYALGGISASLP